MIALRGLQPRISSSKPVVSSLAHFLSPGRRNGTSASAHQTSSLQGSLQELQNFGPSFGVNGGQIRILQEPSEFYQALKDGIQRAQRRVVLASLYLGNGKLEKDLVSCLEHRFKETNSSLQVEILLERTRGTRGPLSSVDLLAPLLEKHPKQMQVSLYESPQLKGLLRSILRPPFNEVLGLTHIKAYIFDDLLLLSGANLSDHYFTMRQDRYFELHSAPLSDYFHKLVSAVSTFSSHLYLDDKGQAQIVEGLHHTLSQPKLKEHVQGVIQPLLASDIKHKGPDADTWVVPLIQMGPYGINNDEQATIGFLRSRHLADASVSLATGYFNPAHVFTSAILASLGSFHILTASPKANGFLGARGIMGHIPAAYTYLEGQFFSAVKRQKALDRISIFEYGRQGWTFHAKGLWCSFNGDPLPSLTFIGSPNFGHRSLYRDLEAQIALVTTNLSLRKALAREKENIFRTSEKVDDSLLRRPDRIVKLWEKLATTIIQRFF